MSARLVVFSGPPCSGKSLLGGRLAEQYGVEHLEMDAFRQRLLPGAAHTREDRRVAYRGMAYAAELLLKHGVTVIVNAVYARDEEREEIAQAAARAGAPLCWVEFTVPVELALERSRARRHLHPGVDLTDERVAELVRSHPYTGAGLTVDSRKPPEDCLALIAGYLGLSHARACAR